MKALTPTNQTDKRTNGRTDKRTDGQTDGPKSICPQSINAGEGHKNVDIFLDKIVLMVHHFFPRSQLQIMAQEKLYDKSPINMYDARHKSEVHMYKPVHRGLN